MYFYPKLPIHLEYSLIIPCVDVRSLLSDSLQVLSHRKGHSRAILTITVNTLVVLLHKAFGEKNEWVNKQMRVNTVVVLHRAAGEKKGREEGKKEGKKGGRKDIISTHCHDKRATIPGCY